MANGPLDVDPANIAAADQTGAIVHTLVDVLVEHWQTCPTRPKDQCVGGVGDFIAGLSRHNLIALLERSIIHLAAGKQEACRATT